MILLLFVASFVLFVWGLIVLFTGGYVATLDIAANLVSSAALVLGLAVLARVAERALAQFSGGAADAAAAPEREAPAEPAPRPAAPSTASPSGPPAASPSGPPAASPASGSDPAKTVIREGVVEGRHFRLYSDGSIDAEGPAGMRRYGSVEELRADMLASAGEGAPAEPEQREAAPEEAREPTARSPFAPRPTTPAPSPEPSPEPLASTERRERSHDAGLGGVRPSERLSPSREAPARSSWSDRFRSTSLFDKDADKPGENGEGGEKPRR